MDGGDVKAGRWTSEEHTLFLQGLQLYNKQWKQIAELVKTRTVVQIRTHAQKYFQKLDKMKDGKTPKPPLMLLDTKDEYRKVSSRSSSITSETTSDSLETDADTDTEEFRWDTIHGPAETHRKRPRPSGGAKQGRLVKRPNLGNSGFSISTDLHCDHFVLPQDEGPALEQSIVNLLEKIDWSGPYSRCSSPFMDSAGSVCSSLDTLQDSFPFFDFGCNTELSTPRTTVIAPVVSSTMDLALGKERLAFSNVMNEMKQVFSSYKIGSYDRLPSIKTLLSIKSSSISVTCTNSLTPSHSTFCHYQLSDSPNLFNDHDFHPIGSVDDSLAFDHTNDDDIMDANDSEVISPTPRKRGRPRKNSI
jgi:SHAQKYF class myb-like DNA-binding protein